MAVDHLHHRVHLDRSFLAAEKMDVHLVPFAGALADPVAGRLAARSAVLFPESDLDFRPSAWADEPVAFVPWPD